MMVTAINVQNHQIKYEDEDDDESDFDDRHFTTVIFSPSKNIVVEIAVEAKVKPWTKYSSS